VQSTYDTIVHNSLSLLRGMSLDERASKLRDQYKTREVTAFLWRCVFSQTTVWFVSAACIVGLWNDGT
jgi:hypothetical protein